MTVAFGDVLASKPAKKEKKKAGNKTVELEQAQIKEKRVKSAYYLEFSHSDPTYVSPTYPEPPKPYMGRDYYPEIIEAAQDVASEFGFVVVETSYSDTVQTGLKWRSIDIKKSTDKHAESFASVMVRKGYPSPQKFVGFSRDSLIAQLEKYFAKDSHTA